MPDDKRFFMNNTNPSELETYKRSYYLIHFLYETNQIQYNKRNNKENVENLNPTRRK